MIPNLGKKISDLFTAHDSGALRIRRAEFRISEELFGEARRAFFVITVRTGRTITLPFSEVLNQALWSRGIRMATWEQEAMRFGEHLLSNLATADELFGRECVDTALCEVLFRTFEDVPVIVGALNQIPRPHVNDLDAFVDCQNFIAGSINGLGNELVVCLNYPDDGTAFSILTGAIAFLLDRRYSLSLRNILFGHQ